MFMIDMTELWSLVDAQAEFRHDAHQMVENIGLLPLERCPGLVFQEEIHIDRHSEGCGFLLGDNNIQIRIHLRVGTQVKFNIYTVYLYVGRRLAFARKRFYIAREQWDGLADV